MDLEPVKDITPAEAVDAIMAAKGEDGQFDQGKVDAVIEQLNEVEFKNDRREFLDDVASIVDFRVGGYDPAATYSFTGQAVIALGTNIAKDLLELIDGDETDNPGYVLRVKGEGYNTPDIAGELASLFDAVNS